MARRFLKTPGTDKIDLGATLSTISGEQTVAFWMYDDQTG